MPDLRRASGLPAVEVLSDPVRVERVRRVAARARASALLPALVDLAARGAATPFAQLSLLADQQLVPSVRSPEGQHEGPGTALEQSLCTVALLSGDVLVAADCTVHPWLRDLVPVASGAVGAYLGVPLALGDGTAVGALCVYDVVPREWSERDVGLTCAVADLVALELRRADDDLLPPLPAPR